MFAEKRGNKWRGRYRDNDGVLRNAGTFTTKREALQAAKARLDSLEQPGDDIATMPLAFYFREHWLKQPHVTPATQQSYEGAFRNHIEPFIGHVPLNELTSKQVRAVLRPHLNEGRLYLANKIKACIGSIYRTLQEEEELDFNPARGIKVKKPDPEPFVPIMPEDFHKILQHLPNDECRFLAVFLAGTGLRWGEATGMKVADFDASTQELRVVRRVMRLTKDFSPNGARHLLVATTKSGFNRLVPASDELSLALMDYVESHDLDGEDLIFRHTDLFGGPQVDDLNNVLWERWNSVLKAAVIAAGYGNRKWRTHSLRHANATLLVAAGVDVVEIQRRLGHRSIITTQRYMHRVKASQSKAAAVTDAFLPPA